MGSLKGKGAYVGTAIILMAVAGYLFFAPRHGKKVQAPTISPQPAFQIENRTKEAEVGRLSKRVDTLEAQIKNTDEAVKALSKQVESLRDALTNLTEALARKGNRSAPAPGVPGPRGASSGPPAPTGPSRIEVIHVPKEQAPPPPPAKPKKRTFLYLPAGALVPGTLVSGVYAPISSDRTLPALLTVDEAFYGPNRTRIPLRGCVVLAKARGRGVEERAEMNPVLLSCVLPNGRPLEVEVGGYVVDARDNTEGVIGKLDRKSWKVMKNTVLVSILETLENMAVSAHSGTAVTGASEAARRLADYEGRILDQMAPSVRVDAGRKVYIVLNKGVVLNGYTPEMAMAGVGSGASPASGGSGFSGLD